MTSLSIVLVLAVALLAAVPAAAQTPRPERPYRGIFGGGVGATEHLLTASASLGGGYDNDVLAGQSGSGLGTAGEGSASVFGVMSGGLSYSLSRERVSFAASGSTSANYYFDLSEPLLASHFGSVGGSWEASRRTRVSASHTLSFQPLYSFGLFPALADPVPGQVVPTDASRGTIREEHLSNASYVSVSQELSARSSLSFSYSQTRTDFSSEDLDVSTRGVHGAFHRDIARGLRLRLGYGYATGHYASTDPAEPDAPEGHTIDAGVDFNRALSFSRRTRLSFATGTTAVKDVDHTQYHITGSADLNHEIGRSWEASLAYNRGVAFVESLREPVFSDSVSFGIGGLISRSIQYRSSAGAAVGEVGLGDDQSAFRSYFGQTGLSFALNRYTALNVNYSYYRYAFDDTAALHPGVTPRLSRHTVQASLNLWAPLVQRVRRPDATR